MVQCVSRQNKEENYTGINHNNFGKVMENKTLKKEPIQNQRLWIDFVSSKQIFPFLFLESQKCVHSSSGRIAKSSIKGKS